MSELETPLQFAPVRSIPEGHGQESAQTSGLRLDLLIEDPETIAALASYPEGRERNRFARTALRIGIIALNQAQGRIDTESVKHEGDRLVREMEGKLSEYRRQTESLLANTLKTPLVEIPFFAAVITAVELVAIPTGRTGVTVIAETSIGPIPRQCFSAFRAARIEPDQPAFSRGEPHPLHQRTDET